MQGNELVLVAGDAAESARASQSALAFSMRSFDEETKFQSMNRVPSRWKRRMPAAVEQGPSNEEDARLCWFAL